MNLLETVKLVILNFNAFAYEEIFTSSDYNFFRLHD